MAGKCWRRRATVCCMWAPEELGIRIAEWRWQTSIWNSTTRRIGRWVQPENRHRYPRSAKPKRQILISAHAGCQNDPFLWRDSTWANTKLPRHRLEMYRWRPTLRKGWNANSPATKFKWSVRIQMILHPERGRLSLRDVRPRYRTRLRWERQRHGPSSITPSGLVRTPTVIWR